jgi:hypothetical protein
MHMFNDIKTETQMQKFLNLEGVLILVVIGADILLEALKNQDWVAAAVIIGGYCVIGGLYWHTLYLDRLFADLHDGISRILTHFPLHQSAAIAQATTVTTTTTVPAHDVLASAVTDRPILHVSNFPLSRNFYATVLAPLGYTLTIEFPALSMAAFGVGGASDLWIKGDGTEYKLRASFSAPSRQAVDDFCNEALNAGGTMAEMPGPRVDRASDSYAAAIYDLDGYTIEAIFYGSIHT